MKKQKKKNFYERMYDKLAGFIRKVFRIQVFGMENEPPEGGYIACPNHISFFDPVICAVAVKRQLHFMAKKELFSVPILGKLITSLGAFPVDRTGSSVGTIKQTIGLLRDGNAVGIFPQGHRFAGEEPASTREHIKTGAAMTAFRAGVPIVPMYIETKKNKVRMFRPIRIYVGKPLTLDEMGLLKGGTEEYERAVNLVFDRILELKDESGEK